MEAASVHVGMTHAFPYPSPTAHPGPSPPNARGNTHNGSNTSNEACKLRGAIQHIQSSTFSERQTRDEISRHIVVVVVVVVGPS